MAPAPSSDPPGPTGAASPTPVPDAAEAAIQAVTARLATQAVEGSSKKRKKTGDGDDSAVADASGYRDYGRAFLRLGDPFTPLEEIIQHGIFVETTEEIDLPVMNEAAREQHDRMSASWEILWRLIGPAFRTEMILLHKQRKLRRRVCTVINGGMVGSRGEDANTFKKHVIQYLHEDTTVAVEPVLNPATKIDRGWYPATQETYDAIENGSIRITADDFPRFLYKPDAVYNPLDVEEGILEGYLMIQMAKCNLQGPASALKPAGSHRGSRGNAAKMGAHAMTGRLVAYEAYQLYFSLSGIDAWKQIDQYFDYKKFYWNIMDLFAGGNNVHVLERFNQEVFGDKAGLVDPADVGAPGCDNEESDMVRLKAQRAAKRIRLEAEAAAAATAATAAATAAASTPVDPAPSAIILAPSS
ncbi:hypothetical protein B0H17DRAFT_1131112 [Mycena rosella]|uniref:Uncharacterized protein n=1 Tax=Mycena rosella TaxID=1033263 RepID=A0AAD7DNZ8_MYCRO|nr:hypothetical protein B0H17DRAFT_1131112 [Mycena rosella]